MKFRKGITAVTLAVAATALGGTPAFAACGQQSSEGHRAQPVAHEQQADITSKASIVATVSGANSAQVRADGAINYTSGQAKFDLNASDDKGATEQSQLIIDGTNVYVKVPDAQLSATGGKPWIKEDVAAEAKSMGFDLDMVMSNKDDHMKSMLQNVQFVGKDYVRGVKTKHYTAQVDLSKLAQQGTEAQTATAQPINVNVWLDRQDRVRKVSFEVSAQGETVDVSVELYAYGSPVDVTIPSEDEVFTAPVAAQPQPAQQKAA